MSFLRTILALSRPARLPTIWSNCLAGWWLGGGGNPGDLPVLFFAATLMFLGGAFLNDAFDAEYDQQHRPARPIPAGAVGHDTVFRWGVAFLAIAALLLLFLDKLVGGIGLALVFFVVVYNAIHRLLPLAPLFRSVCRFLLYLLGAAVAERGITGWAIWCGLAVACYMAGVRWLEQMREKPAEAKAWPIALLVVPVLLALIMDVNGFRESGLLLSAVLVLWSARCLRPAFWAPERDLPRATAGLVSGIVFADWLSACPVSPPGLSETGPREVSLVFIGLFCLAVLLQKLAPE